MIKRFVVATFVFAALPTVQAQAIEFEGTPTVKVEVHEGKATTQAIPAVRQTELRVRIVRDGDRYFWATRSNLPMVKEESGSYVTYTALSGAGYVRVYGPALRSAIQRLPAEQRAREFIYTEHMLHQLGSITYFGK